MTTSTDPADPRRTWQTVARIERLVPPWVLRTARIAFAPLMRFVLRRFVDRDLPVYRGFRLWVEGINADIYLDHLKRALDLLSVYAPVHFRWLRRGFDQLWVNQVFMILRSSTNPDLSARILNLHPYAVWKASIEELALYLAGDGARGRLGHRFQRRRAAATRSQRRVIKEMIAVARHLPSGEPLVARLQESLAAFNREFPEAAAQQAHEAVGPRRPLDREGICLDCGRRRPQPKRLGRGRATVICIRCHEKTALSERSRAILSRDVACDIPADLCFGCIVVDSAYRPAIMKWTKRKRDETIQTFRDMMARPLELIDDWVDSLRHDR